jgi:hypothetical protein
VRSRYTAAPFADFGPGHVAPAGCELALAKTGSPNTRWRKRAGEPIARTGCLGSTDIYSQLTGFDPNWNAAVPYTLLIRPNGEIVYKSSGSIDELRVKRTIIANVADDDYIGHQAYWRAAVLPWK